MEEHFLLGQMQSVFLKFVIESVQKFGIILGIYGSFFLKVIQVYYNACISKKCHHHLVGRQTHVCVTWSRFAGRNLLFHLLLYIWYVVVNQYFVYSYETAQKNTSSFQFNKAQLHSEVFSRLRWWPIMSKCGTQLADSSLILK